MHPLDCKYTILSFPKMLIALTNPYGKGGRGGSAVKEGARVKRASHYYYIYVYASHYYYIYVYACTRSVFFFQIRSIKSL